MNRTPPKDGEIRIMEVELFDETPELKRCKYNANRNEWIPQDTIKEIIPKVVCQDIRKKSSTSATFTAKSLRKREKNTSIRLENENIKARQLSIKKQDERDKAYNKMMDEITKKNHCEYGDGVGCRVSGGRKRTRHRVRKSRRRRRDMKKMRMPTKKKHIRRKNTSRKR